jgi:hypothetical protein
MGEPGTGRFSFVKRYLKAEGKRLQTPADWVYVNNFDEPREPRALELPSGSAAAFIGDINGLIDNLLATFPAVFEHPSYQQKKSAIDRAFNQRYDKALDVIERLALEKDVACTATAATSPSPRWPKARRWTRPSSPSCRKPSASASTTIFPARRAPERRAGQPAAVEARVEQSAAPAQRRNHHPGLAAVAVAAVGKVRGERRGLRLPASGRCTC